MPLSLPQAPAKRLFSDGDAALVRQVEQMPLESSTSDSQAPSPDMARITADWQSLQATIPKDSSLGVIVRIPSPQQQMQQQQQQGVDQRQVAAGGEVEEAADRDVQGGNAVADEQEEAVAEAQAEQVQPEPAVVAEAASQAEPVVEVEAPSAAAQVVVAEAPSPAAQVEDEEEEVQQTAPAEAPLPEKRPTKAYTGPGHRIGKRTTAFDSGREGGKPFRYVLSVRPSVPKHYQS